MGEPSGYEIWQWTINLSLRGGEHVPKSNRRGTQAPLRRCVALRSPLVIAAAEEMLKRRPEAFGIRRCWVKGWHHHIKGKL